MFRYRLYPYLSEILIDGLQFVSIPDTEKISQILLESAKKELENTEIKIMLIKRRLEQHHYICSECNKKIESMERPEQYYFCGSNTLIPDVIHFPKEWNYSNINNQTIKK